MKHHVILFSDVSLISPIDIPPFVTDTNPTEKTQYIFCESSIRSVASDGNSLKVESLYHMLVKFMKDVPLVKFDAFKGKITKITGDGNAKSMKFEKSHQIFFLRYKESKRKLYYSDFYEHMILSIMPMQSMGHSTEGTSPGILNFIWNAMKGSTNLMKIEVQSPRKDWTIFNSMGTQRKDATWRLSFPKGFDWDQDGNMYICNFSNICKVDAKTGVLSLVAGQAKRGYSDGNNLNQAAFFYITGICCCTTKNQCPPLLYVCDCKNFCIRMIDVKSKLSLVPLKEIVYVNAVHEIICDMSEGETVTLAGRGKTFGHEDGFLLDSVFDHPWDIARHKNGKFYVSDHWNHSIRELDVEKGIVSTVIGEINGDFPFENPTQIVLVGDLLFAACSACNGHINGIDVRTKQVKQIQFTEGDLIKGNWQKIGGIAFDGVNHCFYISTQFSIYKLE